MNTWNPQDRRDHASSHGRTGDAQVAKLKQAPVLESARLKLRAHGLDDFARCAAMWADPVVARYIGGKPLSEEEAWTKLLRYAGHWSVMGFGYWAVEEKETSRFIGELDLPTTNATSSRPLGPRPKPAGFSRRPRMAKATPAKLFARCWLGAKLILRVAEPFA